MKRWQRVLVEILGPSALGATAFWIFASVGTVADQTAGHRDVWVGELVQAWLVMMLCGYVFAGPPSLIYAAVMEWRFAHGLDPANWRTVAWSSGLGLLSGLSIGAVMSGGRIENVALLVWCTLGMAVGFILGWFVRWRTRISQRRSE